jgi:hypothetical protein
MLFIILAFLYDSYLFEGKSKKRYGLHTTGKVINDATDMEPVVEVNIDGQCYHLVDSSQSSSLRKMKNDSMVNCYINPKNYNDFWVHAKFRFFKVLRVVLLLLGGLCLTCAGYLVYISVAVVTGLP